MLTRAMVTPSNCPPNRADAGYACLLPNPRGSIGRGHAFTQGVIGDPGGIDLADLAYYAGVMVFALTAAHVVLNGRKAS